jgi:hypothetical protein
LDICTIVDPGFAPAAIPSLTAASAAGSETMMMTTSALWAASAGVAARRGKPSAFAASRFHTVTS